MKTMTVRAYLRPVWRSHRAYWLHGLSQLAQVF